MDLPGGDWMIGVDLDGTLAFHESEWGVSKIGPPVPKMLAMVRRWIEEGEKVVLFTARAADKSNIQMVEEWLEEHGLGGMKITNIKTPAMTILYDDRAVQVQKNTGRIIGTPDRIKR